MGKKAGHLAFGQGFVAGPLGGAGHRHEQKGEEEVSHVEGLWRQRDVAHAVRASGHGMNRKEDVMDGNEAWPLPPTVERELS